MRTALLCLTTVLLAATVCQVNSKVPCRCIKTSDTVLQVWRIKNYKVQKAGPCLIDAVEFLTVRGITVCSDPKKPWVKKAMAAVDARRKTISSTAVPTSTAFRPKWNTTASPKYTQETTVATTDAAREEGTAEPDYRHLIKAVTEQGRVLDEHHQELVQLSSDMKDVANVLHQLKATASPKYTQETTVATTDAAREEGTAEPDYRHLIKAVTEQGRVLDEHHQELVQLSSAMKEIVNVLHQLKATASPKYTQETTVATTDAAREEGTAEPDYRHLIKAVTEQGRVLDEHHQELVQLSSDVKEIVNVLHQLKATGNQPNLPPQAETTPPAPSALPI